jgi:hypothetical protein
MRKESDDLLSRFNLPLFFISFRLTTTALLYRLRTLRFIYHLMILLMTIDHTPEEIAQILRDCDLRGKVVFLLLCGSGLRKGAVSGLQLRDLIPREQFNKDKSFHSDRSKVCNRQSDRVSD